MTEQELLLVDDAQNIVDDMWARCMIGGPIDKVDLVDGARVTVLKFEEDGGTSEGGVIPTCCRARRCGNHEFVQFC